MLEHGSNPNARDKEGYTPLHVHVRSRWLGADNRPDRVSLLLKSGANLNALAKGKIAPLHILIVTLTTLREEEQGLGQEYLSISLEVLDRLLKGGADPNLRTKSGSTARDLAVEGTEEYWALNDVTDFE